MTQKLCKKSSFETRPSLIFLSSLVAIFHFLANVTCTNFCLSTLHEYRLFHSQHFCQCLMASKGSEPSSQNEGTNKALCSAVWYSTSAQLLTLLWGPYLHQLFRESLVVFTNSKVERRAIKSKKVKLLSKFK